MGRQRGLLGCRWDLTEAIKTGFDARGFQILFPQRDLHVFQGEAAVESQPSFQPRRVG